MTDEYIMNPYKMPLARYYQLLRIASKLKREETRRDEERFAWLGWQTTAHEFQMKDKKPPSLKEWLGMVGLQDVDKHGNAKSSIPTEEEKREILIRTLQAVEMDGLRKESLAEAARKEQESVAKNERTIN